MASACFTAPSSDVSRTVPPSCLLDVIIALSSTLLINHDLLN